MPCCGWPFTGESGYFYSSPADCAECIEYLLTYPKAADLMGRRGADYVRDHFLLPDRIADFLKTILMVREMNAEPESIISFHSWHKLDRRK